MLGYLQESGIFCFLDSHQYHFDKSYECIAACGATKIFSSNDVSNKISNNDFFENKDGDWIFGHISYDVKNEFEDLESTHFDGIKFPDFFFFIPEIVFILNENEICLGVDENENPQTIFEAIDSYDACECLASPL